MNRASLFNWIRRKYPSAFGIRRKLQSMKIHRIERRRLSKQIVEMCENNNKLVEYAIKVNQNNILFRQIQNEMSDMINN